LLLGRGRRGEEKEGMKKGREKARERRREGLLTVGCCWPGTIEAVAERGREGRREGGKEGGREELTVGCC